MTTAKESNQIIGVTTKAIEKEYGHVIKWLGDAASETREHLSSGCLGLDNAVGRGGFERGLILEIFGHEGAGKSFLGYSVMLEACKKGHKCAIVDAENSLDPGLLVQIGLPPKQVLVVDGAPTGEANLSIAQSLMETGEFAVVMIDSVAALVPDLPVRRPAVVPPAPAFPRPRFLPDLRFVPDFAPAPAVARAVPGFAFRGRRRVRNSPWDPRPGDSASWRWHHARRTAHALSPTLCPTVSSAGHKAVSVGRHRSVLLRLAETVRMGRCRTVRRMRSLTGRERSERWLPPSTTRRTRPEMLGNEGDRLERLVVSSPGRPSSVSPILQHTTSVNDRIVSLE